MQIPSELAHLFKSLLVEKDMVGRWSGSFLTVDCEAICNEIWKHCQITQEDDFKKVVANFVEDFPFIQRLPRDLQCQQELNDYLFKIASAKFNNLPYSLTAQEIVQESWIKILKNLDTFHYRSRFMTWCTTILIRIALDLLKTENKKMQREGDSIDAPVAYCENMVSRHEIIPSDAPNPEAEYASKELFRLITKVLDKSKNKIRDRYIFERRVDGVSGDCVAGELGISRATVDLVINRLRRRLKEVVSDTQ